MQMLVFFGWLLLGFAGMEIISYLVHRFIFHGLLWDIHRSHHEPTHGLFELNDLFSVFFACISVYLMYRGRMAPIESISFAVGVGIAVYGMLYFIIHDLFAHKRFMPFKSDSKVMRLIRYAHQRHHQSINKEGQEPYGLFLFPYDKYQK
ncbi:sterol desaturase family protein [Fodinibius sp. Rm-B-1B1-1]|uniref:sterol desaturase family protein n=1 Tax=Fodinibius alkaliphilus TaxID=3140241 RepID=UPI00315AF57D